MLGRNHVFRDCIGLVEFRSSPNSIALFGCLVDVIHLWFVHFSCHCNYRPMTSWGWAVRTNHLKHHNLTTPDSYSMLFPIIGRK